jgi:hypothetical protein
MAVGRFSGPVSSPRSSRESSTSFPPQVRQDLEGGLLNQAGDTMNESRSMGTTAIDVVTSRSGPLSFMHLLAASYLIVAACWGHGVDSHKQRLEQRTTPLGAR